MQTENLSIDALTQLTTQAHSPFHCCSYCMEELKKNGFLELRPNMPFHLQPGKKYAINIYDTTCIAFTLGDKLETPSEEASARSSLKSAKKVPAVPQLRMITAHTDWPSFLIKPHPELLSDEYGRLNIEPYGGAVYGSWLDRPLGIAGKICTKGADAFHPHVHLVDSQSPVAIIPGLAIHMNHEINDGVKLNPQLHLLPLAAIGQSADLQDFFASYLENLTGISKEDILDYELYLYNADESARVGIRQELFSSPRIDNYSSVAAALEAISHSNPTGRQICLAAFYHNEEIGSTTKQGANSDLTFGILERIYDALGFDREQLRCSLADGICLSLDVAHALHPNYPDKNDLTNHVCLGDGVALKLSSKQSYATDSSFVSVIQALCEEHEIPYKKYVNRSDLRGGSTLGSILSARLNIPCVDAGVPLLSMHSARELIACRDQAALCQLSVSLFNDSGLREHEVQNKA